MGNLLSRRWAALKGLSHGVDKLRLAFSTLPLNPTGWTTETMYDGEGKIRTLIQEERKGAVLITGEKPRRS